MRVENVKGAVWTVDEVEFYKRRPQRAAHASAPASSASSMHAGYEPQAMATEQPNQYITHTRNTRQYFNAYTILFISTRFFDIFLHTYIHENADTTSLHPYILSILIYLSQCFIHVLHFHIFSTSLYMLLHLIILLFKFKWSNWYTLN